MRAIGSGADGAIGIGVVGAGLWGEAQAKVFATHHNARLAGVCDVDPGRARSLAEKFGVPSYGAIDDLLRDPSLDAVAIATPDFAHRAPAVAAANAGKHIFLEKPLATTLEDVEAIAEAVTRNGVTIVVDFHSRWSPAIVATKRSIERGELGTIVSAYMRLNDTIAVPTEMLSWAAKSSILWFLGSHAVDTLRWLTGREVKSVYSRSRSGVLAGMGIDVPDLYQSMLEFEDGTIATLENSWILPNSHPNVNDIKLNVLGTKGMIDIDLSNHKVMQRFLQDRYDHPDVFVKQEIHGKHMGFAHEAIRDFVDRLAKGTPLVTGLEDGVRGAKVILAMLESAATGRIVAL
jgi:predicted dehydrogenase